MRTPDIERDGWRLDDGEERHRAAPVTFQIPDVATRKLLEPGDYAKLIFEIAVEGDEYPSVERMWVVVRERTANGYVGMLANQPSSIAENDQFWRGTELPFDYRHIISVQPGDAESIAAAKAPVPIPWDRSG
ncbi:hypothetical protein QA640_00125 [Bradyrhizobium sp. CB82]|uniref:hypothetical protein n=1 Tax=Bradyrhizobium sp. CB82 TaxID=3039159 RepID=UPI0024B03DE6|nr:hypothetical protein [Bradyrhizobium sp. CB82]WFU40997.1 hypothetical protein QA640_00125 [Bradyrhizobium sp. CB82]